MAVRYFRLALILLCGSMLVNPPGGESCGPFIPTAQFGYVNNPGPEFLKGELGVLEPGYYRKNLVVAYRYLTGAPLTGDEIDALLPSARSMGIYRRSAVQADSAVAKWLKTRSAVPGLARIDNIPADRIAMPQSGKYRAYFNCLDGAFENAAATLAARIRTWGASSPATAEWVRGQDEVFANCGGDQWDWKSAPPKVVHPEFHAPAPVSSDADPLLAADRRYQIAAALLYAERYEESAESFRAIAREPNSPWRGMGNYLAARALIRDATVGGNRSSLTAAEAELKKALADASQRSVHESATGLLNFIKAQAQPQERMVELAGALSKPQAGAAFLQSLKDFTMLWDRDNKGPADRNDLADWITTFQSRDSAHAIERWRTGGGSAWLVAALTSLNPADEAAPALVQAARRTTPASPAYASAAFHGIRILTAWNQRDEARQWADEAAVAPAGIPAHNAFLAERMALAKTFQEFLRDAPRKPVASTTWTPDEQLERGDEEWRNVDAGPTFDSDAASTFNQRLPLTFWYDAAAGRALTGRLRGEIAQAGWVRAVLLGKPEQARRLAQLTAALRPDMTDEMRKYADEKTDAGARFQAAHTMLRNPGLAPLVLTGFGRLTRVAEIDDFRGNWWNLSDTRSRWGMRPDRPKATPATPEFLSPPHAAAGESEWQALTAAAPFAPDYLCSQVMQWAASHREDPRVPEALHLCVRATRYGMTGPQTTDWSRRAFRLLHSRYPKTDWAAKTKYWY